ncbi:hypothetical protein BH11MYX3_BH11MYX3_44480 [soil metagenome]
MKRTVLVVLASLAGCGNVTNPTNAPGDDAMDAPDAGVPGAPDAPEDAGPPTDPTVLSIVPTQIRDELGDRIDFSSGEPVHTHAGAVVTLGESGCPALHRYAYLLDRSPAFGRQVTTNPLSFSIALPTSGALDSTASAYRVVTPGGDVLLGWTPLTESPQNGRRTIVLYRDDLARLGTYDGPLHFDVRVRDSSGTEQLATACWEHHPMAAPLAIEVPQLATGASALSARTLSASTRVVDVIWPIDVYNVEVFTQRFVQQTAEPITLTVKVGAPAGTYASTIVDTYTPTTTSSVGKDCEVYEAYCDATPLPDPPDLVRSGAIGHGVFTTYFYDDATGVPLACDANTCTLPARGAGSAPHVYRAVVVARRFTDLWQSATTIGEMQLGGHPVIGALLPQAKQIRCTTFHTATIGGVPHTACTSWVEYTEVVGLDRARLTLSATPFQIMTAASGGASSQVPYLPNGMITAPPVSWDGGDGWL